MKSARLNVLLLLAAVACQRSETAPAAAVPAPVAAVPAPALTWPAKAWLRTDGHQLLYDHPATTEAELTSRARSYGVDLRWPAAQGPIQIYEIRKDGRVLASVSATTQAWSSAVESPEGTYQVLAGDGAGHWSAPLEGRWRMPPSTAEINRAIREGKVGILGGGAGEEPASSFGGNRKGAMNPKSK